MIQMIEAWMEIPDLPEEFSPVPESEPSSKRTTHELIYSFFQLLVALIVSSTFFQIIESEISELNLFSSYFPLELDYSGLIMAFV